MRPRPRLIALLTLSILILSGVLLWQRWPLHGTVAPAPTASPPKPARKILYYRNPMGTGQTSPVPMKDNMGMDYIPVYADEAPPKAERKILYYRNPMNPSIHSDRPMKDEMGMDYIPVYAAPQARPGVQVDSDGLRALGVRLAPVRRENFSNRIDAPGSIAVDAHRLSTFTPRVSGWLEKLHVRAIGDPVKKGQLLADIYSPDLLAAQEEYLVARQGARQPASPDLPGMGAENQSLLQASRERLRLLGASPGLIRELDRRGQTRRSVPFYAPYSGVVTEIGVREGGYVSPDTKFFSLANLSQVWLNIELYAPQLAWVKKGDPVTLTLPYLPGRQWRGRIDFLYPTLDPQSRTVQARLAFANPDGTLRPGMYATAHIQTQSRQNVLVVPREAVMRGSRGNTVIVRQADGSFAPVIVQTGLESGDAVEVTSGLQEGQEVVTSGQFLLDSEASFQGAMNRLEGSNVAPARSGGPQHD